MPKSLTLTADDDVFALAIEALCFKGGWQQSGDLTLGEEGKLEFAKGVLLNYLGECITAMKMTQVQAALAEKQQQYTDAIAAANADARSSVTFTVE